MMQDTHQVLPMKYSIIEVFALNHLNNTCYLLLTCHSFLLKFPCTPSLLACNEWLKEKSASSESIDTTFEHTFSTTLSLSRITSRNENTHFLCHK